VSNAKSSDSVAEAIERNKTTNSKYERTPDSKMTYKEWRGDGRMLRKEKRRIRRLRKRWRKEKRIAAAICNIGEGVYGKEERVAETPQETMELMKELDERERKGRDGENEREEEERVIVSTQMLEMISASAIMRVNTIQK
jgi:hypothetical protein